jgi:uncharacterized membrane protein YbaN (DUF454 family)
VKKRLHHPNPVWRATRLIAGILMLLAGAVGGLVPILQGWIFVLAGLMLLAPESRFIRKRIVWMRTRLNLRRRRRKHRGAPGGAGRPAAGPSIAAPERKDS